MRKWGKGGFEVLWLELAFFLLLVLGFVLGKIVIDPAFNYILLAGAGIITGRLSYVKKDDDPLPFKAIGIAFLIGYLLSHRAGSGLVMLALFAAGWLASYKAHQKIDFLA